MISASEILSSLDAGSKERLDRFKSNLRRDYDRRNFDEKVSTLLYQYLTPQWKSEYKDELKYLRNLKSKTDGKFFSQGVKDPEKLLQAGLAFSKPNWTYFGWNRNYQAAKNKLKGIFSKLSLTPLVYRNDDDIINSLPKLGTHAGFTYIETGMKEKRENLEHIYERWKKALNVAIRYKSFRRPILPAVRTQGNGHAYDEEGRKTGDCDHKTRMVSIVDLLLIIGELQFARPIQDWMAGASWYAGGKDLATGVARIITGMRAKYSYWTSLDYSSYDQSISAWLIHDAFDIMHAAFPNLTPEEEQLFQVVEHDFIEKDFIFWDRVIHSVRGVPSGSMFTQIVDSIVNVLVITTYLIAKGLDGDMIVMGDDNLIYTQSPIMKDDLASYLAKNFGMTVNPHKTCQGHADQNPTFLSREWRLEGQYREPHEVIAKMLYPERARNYATGDCKPEEVIYGTYLCYPLGVVQFLDVERFLADFPRLRRSNIRSMGSQSLPGAIAFLRDYTRGFWSEVA